MDAGCAVQRLDLKPGIVREGLHPEAVADLSGLFPSVLDVGRPVFRDRERRVEVVKGLKTLTYALQVVGDLPELAFVACRYEDHGRTRSAPLP